MGLMFIVGRAGSGKTHFCLREIAQRQLKSSNEKLFYIVPEQYTLQAEKDLIGLTENGVIMRAQVLSFSRLCYNILSLNGGLNKTPLSDTGKALVIRKIISENMDKFLYFQNCAGRFSFTEQVCATITELFKYGVSPENLSMSFENEMSSVMFMKAHDIGIIYKQFIKYMSEGYISSETSLDMLYSSMEDSSFVSDGEIWLDGFSSFTPQELKIIERLIKSAKNVFITLTINKAAVNNPNLSETSVFYQTKKTYSQIVKLAEKIGVNVSVKYMGEPLRFKTDGLKNLENGFLYHNPSQNKCGTEIEIYSADTPFDQAQNIVCRIIELRKNGYKFNDMAVLTGNLENSASLIKSMLFQNGIPVFTDLKRELIGHPIIVLVSSLIESVLTSMNYESVFSLIKTGLTPFSNEECEILENYVLAHGIRGSKWQREWSYKDVNSEIDGFNQQINLLREKFLSLISPFSDKISKSKKYTSEEICLAIFSFIDESGAAIRLEEISQKFISNSMADKAHENKQSYNAMCRVFDTMCSITGSDKMSLKEFLDIFKSAVSSEKTAIIPPQLNSVIIGDIERTRLHEVKVLFIADANDGMFPAVKSSGGVFSDLEREKLLGAGVELSETSRTSMFFGQFNVYNAITRPSERLFISFTQSDFSGKSLLPSSIIEKINRLFPNVKTTCLKSPETARLMLNSQTAFLQNMGAAMKLPDGNIFKQAYKYIKSGAPVCRKAAIMTKSEDYGKIKGLLSEKTANEYFGRSIYSSISRLEKFASCPYMYFMSYTMGAKDRPIYQINTPDLGILFHAVLEDFSKELEKSGTSWENTNPEQIEEIISTSVDNISSSIGGDLFLSSNTTKYLVKRLKRISVRTVSTLIDHVKSGAFTPYSFELKFGSGQLPPIVLDIGGGKKMYLTGKVDRVDILDENGSIYVKIIDYKSGGKKFSLQDIYYGLQLQLIIYLDAIIKSGLFKGNDVIPGGVFYFNIKDPIIKSIDELTADDIKRLIEKELKMSGLVLMNENVIRGIDKYFEKSSDIIPISYKSDGNLSQTSSAIDFKGFNAIMDYCLKTASSLGKEIVKGNISPSPFVSGGKTPCLYCAYKSVCPFDSDIHKGRNLKSINKDDIINIIENSEDSVENQ